MATNGRVSRPRAAPSRSGSAIPCQPPDTGLVHPPRLIEHAEPNEKCMAEQAFAEYEFTAQSSKTGRTIHELFSGHLVAANGKIKLLRESVNLVEVALGVFPNGLADYKVPAEHKA